MRKYSFSSAAMMVAWAVVSTTQLAADDQAAVGVVRISDSKHPTPDVISTPVSGGEVVVSGGEYIDGRDGKRPEVVKMPADYGWVPINRLPIYRQPVQYYRQWPDKWYGEPGSGLAPGAPRFPVVYTPTDTTQLGYTYQHVPQWAPNPGMLPPPPWPPQWHLREARVYNNRRTIQWVPAAREVDESSEPNELPDSYTPPAPVPVNPAAGAPARPVDQAT